jgi:hypothetical protein
MTRRLSLVLIALFTLTVAAGSVVRAHERHDHKIMGTVTMAAADHVMLKDKDGKDVTVKVTKDTNAKAEPALKVEEIKAGTRVVITATQGKDKSFTAKTIEVGVVTAVTTVRVVLEIPQNMNLLEVLPTEGATLETAKHGDGVTSITWKREMLDRAGR